MMKKALSENLPDTEATKRRIAGLTQSTEAAIDGVDTLERGKTRSRISVVGKIAACFALCAVIGGAAILPGLLEQDGSAPGTSVLTELPAVTSAPVQTDTPPVTTTEADSSAENIAFKDSDGHVEMQVEFYRDDTYIVADLLYRPLDETGEAFLTDEAQIDASGENAEILSQSANGLIKPDAGFMQRYLENHPLDGCVLQRISSVYSGTLDPTITLRYRMTDGLRTKELALPELDTESTRITLTDKTEYPLDEVVISNYSIRFLTSQTLLQKIAGMTDAQQLNYLQTLPSMQDLTSLKLVYADGTEHFIDGDAAQEENHMAASEGRCGQVWFAVPTEEKLSEYSEYATYCGTLDGSSLRASEVVGIKINGVYYAK